MSNIVVDRLIIGAGLYGLYSALFCARRGDTVVVLEKDDAPFKRATYINQARVHMGYHYPRSLSTAVKSANYYKRFHDDYGFCINNTFDQIYGTSTQFSWTNANEFVKFCDDAGIYCEPVDTDKYFNRGLCDGAFLTHEDTYDALILRNYFVEELNKYSNVSICYSVDILDIVKKQECFEVITHSGDVFISDFVLNATYASVNQIHRKLGYDPFNIKYELCEIILCNVNNLLESKGITVMDGPFFSIMPFGKSGLHSLTSVTFTPHHTSQDECPEFECQERSDIGCTKEKLANCNECASRPISSWPYMSSLARKYLKEDYRFEYCKSLYSMKPILKTTEIDDSRPTVIRVCNENPKFVSVLSGKINTVYDLDDILKR